MNNDSIKITYDRFLQMIKDCQINLKECYNEVNSKVAYKQYGLGGECLHRGYYCPSLIADIITGNASRGKILNRKPITNNSTFIFGFDHGNKLIFVEQPDLCEFIFRQEQSEIGIAVSKDMKIEFVSECRFSGEQIYSYDFCLYNSYEKCIVELTSEKYAYLENQVDVIWSRTLFLKDTWVKQCEKYTFFVENGYLTSYRVQEVDENGIEKNVRESRSYKVRLKRKI